MNGNANDHIPGAMIRGSARNGLGLSGENGVFSVDAEARPSDVFNTVGLLRAVGRITDTIGRPSHLTGTAAARRIGCKQSVSA